MRVHRPLALRLSILVMLSIVGAPLVRADVRLPAIVSDHMVLQAEAPAPIWGWAEPGEEVSVSLVGQTQRAQADADGKWMVRFDKLKASNDACELTVAGKNTLTVRDVLIGEVWLASGQSNMAFGLQGARDGAKEIAAANFPTLRMFTVKHALQSKPQLDCVGKWEVCTPQTAPHFSAVAYFFGRELLGRLGTPVGLINSSVGGTDITAWTSEEAHHKIPELESLWNRWLSDEAAYDPAVARANLERDLAAWNEQAEQAKAQGKFPTTKPSLRRPPSSDSNHPAILYNGMIAPLIPYAIRGAIWYQGESNCSTRERATLYKLQLPAMIEDWRGRWGVDFPFAWVQLPNFSREDYRPLVREAMLEALRLKHTGMAITIDVGESGDQHPKNKLDVGLRLAYWALGDVYGVSVPSSSGPLPDGHATQGGKLSLSFRHADGGLVAKDGALRGFVIAGEDRQWKPAEARIEGQTVIVSHPDVPNPVAARYDWANDPPGNLYNEAGLPASPFRTDDWPVLAP